MSSINTWPRDDADAQDIPRQAAEWLTRLSADDSTPADRLAFESWKAADPRHAQAALSFEAMIGRLQEMRKQVPTARAPMILEHSLASPTRRNRSRRAGAALVLLLGLLIAVLSALVGEWPSVMLADLRTAPGEWQTHTLADRSEITLGSSSAVNVALGAHERHIELLKGIVLVDVAPDASRPFVVETRQGRIRALGTRFTVRRDGDATVLTMLESKTWVQTTAQSGSPAGTVVKAGEVLRFTAGAVGETLDVDVRSVSDAWRYHQLAVRDQSLPEVLDTLSQYRAGTLRFDREALMAYRVSVVLPLDDTDRALQLLADALPIRVRARTPWWISIELAEDVE